MLIEAISLSMILGIRIHSEAMDGNIIKINVCTSSLSICQMCLKPHNLHGDATKKTQCPRMCFVAKGCYFEHVLCITLNAWVSQNKRPLLTLNAWEGLQYDLKNGTCMCSSNSKVYIIIFGCINYNWERGGKGGVKKKVTKNCF